MIQNELIICFSNNEWAAVPTSKEHAMKILSEKNRVIYVENIGQRKPFFKLDDFRKIFQRLKNWSQGPQKVNPNLTIISPLFIPFYHSSFWRWFNQKILIRQIEKAIDDDCRQPILWISIPTAAGLVGKLNEKLSIYHCVDDFSAFEVLDFDLISRLEKELMEKVDLIFVSNLALSKIKAKNYPKKTFFIPHGGNVDNFLKAAKEKSKEPIDLIKIPRPRITFAGKIGYSTDLSLIDYLARENPGYSFVMLGPIGFDAKPKELNSLKTRKNVFFLGKIPYQKLPLYFKYLDVFLLSYRLTKQIKYCQPQVMYEYLATGRPTISVNISAADQFKDLIYIGKNFRDFNRKLQRAVREKNKHLIKKRIETAKENSWPKRIEEISKIIMTKSE